MSPGTYDHILGIDPGTSGACALRKASHQQPRNAEVLTFDKGAMGKFILPYTDKVSFLVNRPVALIEKVWGSPMQGASQAFAFGENFGLWKGAIKIAGIPLFEVTPQRWQKGVGFESSLKEMPRKRALRDFAQKLFPDIRVTLDNSDALLISEYALLQLNAGKPLGDPL